MPEHITSISKTGINFNEKHVNQLHIRQYIHSISSMSDKNMALSDKYEDLMKYISYTMEGPIMKKHKDICPKNAADISNTAKLIVSAMNFYF